MGVQLPTNGRDLLPFGGVTAVRGSLRASRLWILGLALLAVAYFPLLRGAGYAEVLSGLPWTLAAALAVLGWGHSAARAESRASTAFRVLQLAAVLGVIGYLACSYQPVAPLSASVPVPSYLLLLPHVAMALGIGLTLGPRRGRVWIPRLAADTTLIMLAVVAAALRLVVEPAAAQAAGVGLDRTLLAVLQSVTVVPVFLAAQVVLRRGTALSPSAGSLVLAATLAFALGGLFSLTDLDRPFHTIHDPSDWVELAGWLLFALAGFRARRLASTAPAMLAGRRAPDALRRLLVPGAALFLALAVVDMGLGRPPRLETVLAVALLGVVLAIRTGQAFNLADREEDQRRQLAHTRALVDVTHALAGATDLDKTLRIISESARSVFGTRGAGIELITEDGRQLETRSAVGLPREVLGLRFPLESSFTGWVVQHQEPRATADPSRDPYIQPQSLAFLGRWPVAAAPIHFRGETLGALFACIRPELFDVEELELMGALAEQAAIAIQQARLFEQVTILSITDPLTGLANRRQLEIELPREFAAARRGRDLTAVMFDLDMFKHYNDTHGHLAGDEALQAFARSLQLETRAMNLAARYGGDEFVAILAGTDADGGRIFIERVRERFAREVAKLGHGPLPASAGLAEFAPDMLDPEALLRAADDSLYRAKPRSRVGVEPVHAVTDPG